MMKISCDTNLIIAAVITPDGGAMNALNYLKRSPVVEFVLTDYVYDEVFGVVQRDHPHKVEWFDNFMKDLDLGIISLDGLQIPQNLPYISDPKDRPILPIIMAQENHVDVFIAFDSHFRKIANQVPRPRIMPLQDFEFEYFAQVCYSPSAVFRKHNDEAHRKALGNGGYYMTTTAPPRGNQADPLHPLHPRAASIARTIIKPQAPTHNTPDNANIRIKINM